MTAHGERWCAPVRRCDRSKRCHGGCLRKLAARGVHDGTKFFTAFAGSKGFLPLLPAPRVADLQAIVQDMRNLSDALRATTLEAPNRLLRLEVNSEGPGGA